MRSDLCAFGRPRGSRLKAGTMGRAMGMQQFSVGQASVTRIEETYLAV
jgi:hypothetical protein